MNKLVIKIGGSILVNENSYKTIAKRITELVNELEVSKLYLIVSAKKNETDKLISQIAKNGDEEKLKKALRGEFRFLEYDTPRISEKLLQGEIDSALKFKEYLPNASLIIQNELFPIISNTSYLSGKIDFEESNRRKKFLDISEKIVIVPGFGGVDLAGNKVLLGRNASDLVAAMIAKLANVDMLIYLKDVKGVFRHFGKENQEIVSELNYSEAREFGLGQVLDSRVLDVLSDSSLEIMIGHQNDLKKLIEKKCGTRITRVRKVGKGANNETKMY